MMQCTAGMPGPGECINCVLCLKPLSTGTGEVLGGDRDFGYALFFCCPAVRLKNRHSIAMHM